MVGGFLLAMRLAKGFALALAQFQCYNHYMVAQTTDDILRELDRTQGGPVQFEDPRTHAQYVLIPHEAYCLVRPFLGLSQASNDAPVEWSDAKNHRRLALIKQEVAGKLTADDKVQLERLQDEFYRYREQIAPLPSAAMLELIEESLARRAAEQPPAAAS